ncbi:threonine/homoserine/homoserine lactone efflux protein [Alteromonadaceae bacterium 2753L.S.0a.02]|nr:threonine/homoserine/homoserine lactone efflux protein [Alteromonadaceae bacterium 2753L.S.0a.02]
MEISQIITFTLIAALLVISPGPNSLLIVKNVSYSGKKAGFANIAGFVAAFYLHGAFSIFGISVLLTQSAQAFSIVKLLGAIYLCWVGLKALWSAWFSKRPTQVLSAQTTKKALINSFTEGFLTNALNPKVSLFYLAIFPQFIPISGSLANAFILVFIHTLINITWFSGMVFVVARLKNLSGTDLYKRVLNTAIGVMFLGFSASLAKFKN